MKKKGCNPERADWFGVLPTESARWVGLGRNWSGARVEIVFWGVGGFMVNGFSQGRAERSPTGRGAGVGLWLWSLSINALGDCLANHDENKEKRMRNPNRFGQGELLVNSCRIWSGSWKGFSQGRTELGPTEVWRGRSGLGGFWFGPRLDTVGCRAVLRAEARAPGDQAARGADASRLLVAELAQSFNTRF
jgi:hypothetical protein